MPRNIPLFIAFRLLFNARFYYPIFAVLQLDYGLTMAQFAILNAIWAVSIVLLEVPSGALADKLGRRPMIIIAAVLMILEMSLIAFVPFGNANLIFWVWVLNRILSGAAEASASGADEALAYDSLPEGEQEAQWPKVLARLMTLSSCAFVVAMLIGGAVYDHSFLNNLLGTNFAKETAIRFPIYLTLISALIALPISLLMKEPVTQSEDLASDSLWTSIHKTGGWIIGTPIVFALILAALVHDTLVRLFLTMNSEYYRLIDLPESSFGIIGASFAAMGILMPRLARRMVEKGRLATNSQDRRLDHRHPHRLRPHPRRSCPRYSRASLPHDEFGILSPYRFTREFLWNYRSQFCCHGNSHAPSRQAHGRKGASRHQLPLDFRFHFPRTFGDCPSLAILRRLGRRSLFRQLRTPQFFLLPLPQCQG